MFGTAIPAAALDESKPYTYEDLDFLFSQIEEQHIKMDAAKSMEDAAKTLGYDEKHEVIQLAQKEYQKAYRICLKYETIYNNLISEYEAEWEIRKQEYPYATYIWNYFKELDYNDYVIAGIIGNLMSEVGGSTLNIKYWSTSAGNGYYGMCQWSKSYAEVWGKSLKEQCDFLAKTIQYELDTFGYAYKKNFNYKQFLSLTNEKEAAKAFAKCYERCNSAGISRRQRNATVAYNYFVN